MFTLHNCGQLMARSARTVQQRCPPVTHPMQPPQGEFTAGLTGCRSIARGYSSVQSVRPSRFMYCGLLNPLMTEFLHNFI
jgi:hypothetical protein